MTNQEILKKAVTKASYNSGITFLMPPVINGYGIYRTIFDHDFARAFWGEEYVCSNCLHSLSSYPCSKLGHKYSGIEWQLRLQQMILKKEPLKYIERFL